MSVGVVCQPFSMSSDRCHLYPASTFDSASSIAPGCDDNINKVYADGWTSPYNVSQYLQHSTVIQRHLALSTTDEFLISIDLCYLQGASTSEPTASPFLAHYSANQYIRTPSLPLPGHPVTFRPSFEPSPANSSYFTPSSTTGQQSDGIQSTASYAPDVSDTRSSSLTPQNQELSNYSWNFNNEPSRVKSPKDIGGVYPVESPKTGASNPQYNPFDPLYEIPIPSGPQPVKPIPSQPLPSSTKPPSFSKKRPNPDGRPDSPADGIMPSPKKPKNESFIKLIESSPGLSSAALGLEDSLLLKWRDEETLSWKMVAAKFQHELGRTYNVPALQMRLKRLRERLRAWVEVDVTALRLAHEYWEKKRWDIVADKVRHRS